VTLVRSASAAIVSRRRGQATAGGSGRRHLSQASGQITSDGPVSALPADVLRSLARYAGRAAGAAIVVRQEDQRTAEDAVRRHVVREQEQRPVERWLGRRLVCHAERSAVDRRSDRTLVPVPDRDRFLDPPASQTAIARANPTPNRGFLRPAERGASQTAADSPLVRSYERWAFQGIGA